MIDLKIENKQLLKMFTKKMSENFKLPLRSLLKDSRRDFFKDFRLDMGLSSALAMSKKEMNKN